MLQDLFYSHKFWIVFLSAGRSWSFPLIIGSIIPAKAFNVLLCQIFCFITYILSTSFFCFYLCLFHVFTTECQFFRRLALRSDLSVLCVFVLPSVWRILIYSIPFFFNCIVAHWLWLFYLSVFLFKELFINTNWKNIL